MIANASDLYLSAPLTNVSIAYTVDATEYVASRIFPVVKVKKQSAKYYEYPRGMWFQSAAQKRGPGQESAGTSWRVESKEAYHCDVFALHVDIDDFARSNADSAFQLDAEATRFLQGQILLKRELEFLAKHFVTGKWGLDMTPTPKWDAANATIIADIRDASESVKMRTGLRPNKLIVQERVWNRILEAADIIDRIKGGGTSANPAAVTKQAVAAILELDEVIVAGAIRNTAAPGLTDAFNFMAGNHALLVHVPRAPGLMTPSAGYTFVWTDLVGVGPEGERVAKFRMENLRSDRVECEGNWDHKMLGADLGVLIHDVLTV